MAYTKHQWQARLGSGLNRFTDQRGTVYEFTSTPTQVTQEGTPFSAAWMNEMETGIDESYPTTISLTLPASWTDAGNGSFTQVVAVSGLADGMQINVAPDVAVLTQMAADGVSALFIQNNNGTATAVCMGAALTASVTVQATLEVVK